MEDEIFVMENDNLESIVYTLLAEKARGNHVYCKYKGHKLHSDNVSMDSAYMEITGYTKEEYDKRANNPDKKTKSYDEILSENVQKYAKKVEESKKQSRNNVITKSKIINGLRFIAENPQLKQEELLEGLLYLGCNFTLDDIKKQFPEEVKLFDGLKKGDISCGACVIANMRDSEIGRSYCADRFLSIDGDYSIYNFIRMTTKDRKYTKDFVNELIAKNTEGEKKSPIQLAMEIEDENPHSITKNKVIRGLKFIAENQSLDSNEFRNGIYSSGCYFTLDDIKEQFPEGRKLFESMRNGDIDGAACMIVNMRDDYYARGYCTDRFLSIDDEFSIYNFIRLVTGDETYTKENIESQNQGGIKVI